MPFPFVAGAVVYARQLSLVSEFYRCVMGLRVAHAEAGHIVLESAAFQLTVVAIPEHLAAETGPAAALQRRDDAAVKLVFPVDSIVRARATARALGGELNPPEHEWEFQGSRVCDGHDPEGNVVQVRGPAALP